MVYFLYPKNNEWLTPRKDLTIVYLENIKLLFRKRHVAENLFLMPSSVRKRNKMLILSIWMKSAVHTDKPIRKNMSFCSNRTVLVLLRDHIGVNAMTPKRIKA